MPPKMKMSSSCPALNAGFSLREYSISRKHLVPERSMDHLPPIAYEQVDVVGGNGRWRQRKAKEEWARLETVEAQKMRELQLLEQERRRRKLQADEKCRAKLEEERLRFRNEQERKAREQLEREEQRRRDIEKERLRVEQERQDWLARQPIECSGCSGNGLCPACDGKAFSYETFLVSKVSSETPMDYGRVMQGCSDCGGCRQNILGALQKGSGKCSQCGGSGKIWPLIALSGLPSPARGRFAGSAAFASGAPKASGHGTRRMSRLMLLNAGATASSGQRGPGGDGDMLAPASLDASSPGDLR